MPKNTKRAPLIANNPILDKIAHRFAAKIRSSERIKKNLQDEMTVQDKKLSGVRAALNALKAGAGA